jgi:hypothetical protein
MPNTPDSTTRTPSPVGKAVRNAASPDDLLIGSVDGGKPVAIVPS